MVGSCTYTTPLSPIGGVWSDSQDLWYIRQPVCGLQPATAVSVNPIVIGQCSTREPPEPVTSANSYATQDNGYCQPQYPEHYWPTAKNCKGRWPSISKTAPCIDLPERQYKSPLINWRRLIEVDKSSDGGSPARRCRYLEPAASFPASLVSPTSTSWGGRVRHKYLQTIPRIDGI